MRNYITAQCARVWALCSPLLQGATAVTSGTKPKARELARNKEESCVQSARLRARYRFSPRKWGKCSGKQSFKLTEQQNGLEKGLRKFHWRVNNAMCVCVRRWQQKGREDTDEITDRKRLSTPSNAAARRHRRPKRVMEREKERKSSIAPSTASHFPRRSVSFFFALFLYF